MTNNVYSDLREYRRGRLPGDMTERWQIGGLTLVDGTYSDHNHKNFLQINGDPSSTARCAFSWNPVDSMTGNTNQEWLIKFRPITSVSTVYGLNVVLRGGGSVGSENAYRLVIFDNGTWQLFKFVAGVSTSLASTSRTFTSNSIYWLRYRVNGTTLSASVWVDGDTEPVSWDKSITDSSLSSGWMGFHLGIGQGTRTEILYMEAATNGDSCIGESQLPPPMETWVSNPDEEVEYVAKFEYYNPGSGLVESSWYSTIGQSGTSITDYPASTVMDSLLTKIPGLESGMEADQLFSDFSDSQLTFELDNAQSSPGGYRPLDSWINYSFYGRPVALRCARKWKVKPSISNPDGIRSPLRDFEMISATIPIAEPSRVGDRMVVNVKNFVDNVNTQPVPVNKNIGIDTCVRILSTTGTLTIPNHASYNMTSFKISGRWYLPLAGVAGSTHTILSRREAGGLGTNRQWYIGFYNASHATNPNKLFVLSYNGSGTAIVNYVSTRTYNLGRFVDIIFGIQTNGTWYFCADGAQLSSGTLANDGPAIASGAAVNVCVSPNVGVMVFDHRIEQFSSKDEALGRFATRKEPDSSTISMHRCDDNTGSTVTDYGTIANHGTLAGTNGVDRDWYPTYLGGIEVAGTPMPMSGGVVYNFPTQNVDTKRGLYRYNDRARLSSTDLKIRAKGLLLTGGGVSYSEPSDAPGLVDFTGSIDPPITAGIEPTSGTESSSIHVPQLVSEELIKRGAQSISSMDRDSFYGLRTLLPYRGGFYYSDPPKKSSSFISDMLGPLGAHAFLDSSGRIATSILLPPINPGPYGQDRCLEFLGIPNRGVTFSPYSGFSLTQDPIRFSLCVLVKFHSFPYLDRSVSSSFTNFPSGMTLIDRTGKSNTGYYLGIDGRNGNVIFGAPGIVSSTTGLNFHSYYFPFQTDRWYAISGTQSSNTRTIRVVDITNPDQATNSGETTTGGSLTDPTSEPLRIGHGSRGTFYGSIMYAIGSSSNRVTNDYMKLSPNSGLVGAGRPTPLTGSIPNANDRFFIELREGSGDTVLDSVSNRSGYIEGCRWCPQLTLDYRSSGAATLKEYRAMIPAWRVEGRYKKNYNKLEGANIAAGVSASDRAALQQEYLSTANPDFSIYTDKYLNSREIILSTPLTSDIDTEVIDKRFRYRVSTSRRTGVGSWFREIRNLSLGSEVLLYDYTPSELSSGRPMRVSYLSWKPDEDEDGLAGDVTMFG